jgi:hypothetical protein
MPPSDMVCIGDLGVTYQDQQERMKALWEYLHSLGGEALDHLKVSAQGARGDGGALLYFLRRRKDRCCFKTPRVIGAEF